MSLTSEERETIFNQNSNEFFNLIKQNDSFSLIQFIRKNENEDFYWDFEDQEKFSGKKKF